jgi:hypothetical protein
MADELVLSIQEVFYLIEGVAIDTLYRCARRAALLGKYLAQRL